MLLWSKQSDTNSLFHPFTGPVPTAGMTKLLRTMLAIETNAKAELKVGYQLSDSGNDDDWDTAVDLGASWLSAINTHYGTTWVSVGSTKRFIRFGFSVKNQSSETGVHAMHAEVVIDVRGD